MSVLSVNAPLADPTDTERLEDVGPGEDPYARELERYMDRRGPGGIIPENALLNAKAQMDAMEEWSFKLRDGGIWSWEWMGPGNIGGRIRSIVIHPTNPNRMWVGSVSGGIWKTTNGGDSWSPVNDFLASLSIGSMAIDPINPNVMYAGTGEFTGSAARPGTDFLNAGIFKSLNGGDTWLPLQSEDFPTSTVVGRIAHHPSISGWLLAVSSDFPGASSVWLSTDAGTSWTNVQTVSGINGGGPLVDVKFQPVVGTRDAMAGGNGRAFYSTDWGYTWTDVTGTGAGQIPRVDASGTAQRIEVALGGTVDSPVAYVSVNRVPNTGPPIPEVWRSVDRGANWTLQHNQTGYLGNNAFQANYNNTIWVAPDDPDLVVVGGINLWRSEDGARTLTRISNWRLYNDGLEPGRDFSAHADQHILLPHPFYDGTNNRTLFVGNDGGIQVTGNIKGVFENGVGQDDAEWVNLANNLGITQFYSGVWDFDWGFGCAQDNSIVGYRESLPDPKNQWIMGTFDSSGVSLNFTGDGMRAVYSGVNITYHATTQFLRIWTSTQGGSLWQETIDDCTECGSRASARFEAPFVGDPNDGRNLVGGGLSIWYSTDRAASWNPVRVPQTGGPFVSALRVAPGNSNRIWAGYGGGLQFPFGGSGQVSRTTNSVTTWNDVDNNGPNPLPDGRTVMDIAINPLNENEVFVAFGGYFDDQLWFTSDNGDSWEERTGSGTTGLPVVHISAVTIHPMEPNWVYVGTDIGVFASEDKGRTWRKTPRYPDSNGMEGPKNVIVEDLFWDGSFLYAATFGRGMFRSRPFDVVYVDGSYTGQEFGTEQNPFNTIQEALDVQGHGTTLSIRTGVYVEAPITFARRGRVIPTEGAVTIR